VSLIMLAAMCTGALVGLAVGTAIGYPRGHRDGAAAGVAQQRAADASWERFLETTPGYAQQLAHGTPGHRCSRACPRVRSY
jgi:hypothetical protein